LTMQRLLQERSELRIVDDQIGAPTWAGSVANSTLAIIEEWQRGNEKWGTYHLTAQGQVSWFGFAQAIRDALQRQGKPAATLLPISSAEYPAKAARPLNSRLDCSKLENDWCVSQPHWQESLFECLNEQN